jgi:hypothetical protein
MILLGAVSLLFSIAIALIPFLASRLVRGDVGNTVFALAAVVNRSARGVFSQHLSSSEALPAGPPSAMTEPGPPTGGGPGSAGTTSAPNTSAGSGALAESKPPAPMSPELGSSAAGPAAELGSSGAVLAV